MNLERKLDPTLSTSFDSFEISLMEVELEVVALAGSMACF
jgi:hypothetical protein